MKQTSDRITIGSVPKFEIVLTPITIIESIAIAKQIDKMGVYEHISLILEQVSNLDKRQISEMFFQDAIALLLYHRMYFWDNFELVESPSLHPRDFIVPEGDMKEVRTKIGDYIFSNHITLSDAIKAEHYASLQGHSDYLNLYVMASGCTKSLEKGVLTLMALKDTENDKGLMYELSNQLSLVGNVRVNLILDIEQINLITGEGSGNYALPFRSSRIFEYGL